MLPDISSTNQQTALTLHQPDTFLNNQLYVQLSRNGFDQVNWSEIPDEFLLYIYLHKNPQLGKDRTPQTKAKYLESLKPFMSYATEHGGIRYLTSSQVYAYQLHLERDKEYKPTTLSRHTVVIKQFLQFLYKEEMIERDITTKMIKVAKPKDQLVDRDLHSDEVKQLLKHFKGHDFFTYALLSILLSTGMRIAELANADMERLVWRSSEQAYFLDVEGKGKKQRPIVIYEDALSIIKELRRQRGFSEDSKVGPFFPKTNGKRYSATYLSGHFKHLLYEAPFDFVQSRKDPITAHTCRHYTAQYLIEQGADLTAIRDALGHASIQTTELYLKQRRRYSEHVGLKIKPMTM
ncbi:hypothetical protein DH09_00645 (plasmid) [Bacillaceae bacterium JMAK1]|nr:hypothetical protein DH09_00645 [Bacillaceae bacterium JMAK1]